MSAEQITPRRRRRKISRIHSKPKPPKPSFSSTHSSANVITRRFKPTKAIKVDLQRCHSEPILWTIGLVFDDEEEKKNDNKFDDVAFSRHSCVDIFAPSPVSPFALNSQRYNKDAKVVVNVTVEGSPGPVRSLIKLGASVEDTIKLVVDKYKEEGRSPQLGQSSVSSFELHHSHFSLESISKKDAIGDIGTRSFYLRKSCSGHSTEAASVESSVAIVSPFIFMPALVATNMNKIGRRMCKLWKVLICSR